MNAVKSLIYRDLCIVKKPITDTLWFIVAMGAAGLLMMLSVRCGNLRPMYEAEDNRLSAEFLIVTMESCFVMTVSIIFLYVASQSDKKWESYIISTPITANEFALSKTLVSASSLVLALPVGVVYATAMGAIYPYGTVLPHIRLVIFIVSGLVILKSISDISVKYFKSDKAGFAVMGIIGAIVMAAMYIKLVIMADTEDDLDIDTLIASLHLEITGPAAPFAAAAVIVLTHFVLKALYKRRAE